MNKSAKVVLGRVLIKSGSVIDVRFTPNTTKLLRSSEMTRMGWTGHSQVQQNLPGNSATRSPRRRGRGALAAILAGIGVDNLLRRK
jgi:hypothetical protein